MREEEKEGSRKKALVETLVNTANQLRATGKVVVAGPEDAAKVFAVNSHKRQIVMEDNNGHPAKKRRQIPFP